MDSREYEVKIKQLVLQGDFSSLQLLINELSATIIQLDNESIELNRRLDVVKSDSHQLEHIKKKTQELLSRVNNAINDFDKNKEPAIIAVPVVEPAPFAPPVVEPIIFVPAVPEPVAPPAPPVVIEVPVAAPLPPVVVVPAPAVPEIPAKPPVGLDDILESMGKEEPTPAVASSEPEFNLDDFSLTPMAHSDNNMPTDFLEDFMSTPVPAPSTAKPQTLDLNLDEILNDITSAPGKSSGSIDDMDLEDILKDL